LTIGNYPRKIDEYLILGKPVVATYTEFMLYFKKHVYLCHGLEDYLHIIRKLMQKEDEEIVKLERIAFARSHTWENSLNLLFENYNKVLLTRIKK
jgi:aspartate/tyrosine/aromatic aminotransferase